MPSSTEAQSVQIKALASGLYSFYWNVAETVLDTGAKLAGPAVATLMDCLNGCSNQNLCAGIAWAGYVASTDAITSCTYIMGTVEPGNSRRSLTRTKFTSLHSGLGE